MKQIKASLRLWKIRLFPMNLLLRILVASMYLLWECLRINKPLRKTYDLYHAGC